MKNFLSRSTRSIAVILNIALVLTSLPAARSAQAAGVSTPLLDQLQFPSSIGTVTETHNLGNPRVVLLIQDLHLHYPTQKRILSILDRLQERGLLRGQIAIEGASGNYDLTSLASFPAGQDKEKLVDYFMQKGELSADEAFAILRNEPHRLRGVDHARFYDLNRRLYRDGYRDRGQLLKAIGTISDELTRLKRTHFSWALRRLDRREIFDVASAEELLRAKRARCTSPLQRQIVDIEHVLHFARRVLRQEAALDEVSYVSRRLPQFVQLTADLMKSLGHNEGLINPARIEETFKTSVDFYPVALMRDEPLAQNTLTLVAQQKTPVVLISGGFHTAGITAELRKKGVGYAVITPFVDQIDPAYHSLYERRVLGESLTPAEVARDFRLTWTPPARAGRAASVAAQSLRVRSNLTTGSLSALAVVRTAYQGLRGRFPEARVSKWFASQVRGINGSGGALLNRKTDTGLRIRNGRITDTSRRQNPDLAALLDHGLGLYKPAHRWSPWNLLSVAVHSVTNYDGVAFARPGYWVFRRSAIALAVQITEWWRYQLISNPSEAVARSILQVLRHELDHTRRPMFSWTRRFDIQDEIQQMESDYRARILERHKGLDVFALPTDDLTLVESAGRSRVHAYNRWLDDLDALSPLARQQAIRSRAEEHVIGGTSVRSIPVMWTPPPGTPPSPFQSASEGTRNLPLPVQGIPYSSEMRPSAEDTYQYSQAAAQAVAIGALLKLENIIHLSRPIKTLLGGSVDGLEREDFLKHLEAVLWENQDFLQIQDETVRQIVDRAGKENYDRKDPVKAMVSAVKKYADTLAKKAIQNLFERVYSHTPDGVRSLTAAAEGLGQRAGVDDLVEEGEAYVAGEVIRIPPNSSLKLDEATKDRLRSLLNAIGLQRYYYMIVDPLECTNAAVGSIERGLLFVDEVPEDLRERVTKKDLSGATAPAVTIKGEMGQIEALNMPDGYAHTIFAQVDPDKAAEFLENPLDPDDFEFSLDRLMKAWDMEADERGDVEVVVLNRHREEKKIRRLAALGYSVTVIPDGTLMPAVLAGMGGHIEPGKRLVVLTTAGGPEAVLALAANKAMRAQGSVGAVRPLPETLDRKGNWLDEYEPGRWRTKAGLSQAQVDQFRAAAQAANGGADLEALNEALLKEGKYSVKQLREYHQLRPDDWEQVITQRRFLTFNDVLGDVDAAFGFITDNPLFKEKGVDFAEDHPSDVIVHVLRIKEDNGSGKTWIQKTRGNVHDIVQNRAVLANLEYAYRKEVMKQIARERAQTRLPRFVGRPKPIAPVKSAIALSAVRRLNEIDPSAVLPLNLTAADIQTYLKMGLLPTDDSDLVLDGFRDYDVRFRYEGSKDVPLEKQRPVPSPAVFFRLGLAVARMTRERQAQRNTVMDPFTAVLARDVRDNSDPGDPTKSSQQEAFAAGLMYGGVNVIYIGEHPNSASSYATAMAELRPDIGVLRTASHVSEEDHVQIAGLKISIRPKKGEEAASLSTDEIKGMARSLVVAMMQDPPSVKTYGVPEERWGRVTSVNLDALNIRYHQLVGRIEASEHPGINWYEFKKDLKSGDKLSVVLDHWERKLKSTGEDSDKPFEGLDDVIDWGYTPTGALMAEAEESLGVKVYETRAGVRPVKGLHTIDPSKDENMVSVKTAMMEHHVPTGSLADVDGDRLGLRDRLDDGSMVDVMPDSLVTSLLRYRIEKAGFTPENSANRRLVIIIDVLSSQAVKDAVARIQEETGLSIEVHRTDSGYVYLNQMERQLQAEARSENKELVVLFKAEFSGHIWSLLPRENPIELKMARLAMAARLRRARLQADPAYNGNPFADSVADTVPLYLRTARMQPAITHEALHEAVSKQGQKWNGEKKSVTQAMIADVKHETILKALEHFQAGREFATMAGPFHVEHIDARQENRDGNGMKYVFADIYFRDAANLPAGRFVIRASANDPTFVSVVESKVRDGELKDLTQAHDRFQAIAGIAGGFLEDHRLAYIADQSRAFKADVATDKGLAAALSRFREWLRSSTPAILGLLTVGYGMLFLKTREAGAETLAGAVHAAPLGNGLLIAVGAVMLVGFGLIWMAADQLRRYRREQSASAESPLASRLKTLETTPQPLVETPAPPSTTLLTAVLDLFRNADDRRQALELLAEKNRALLAAA